MKRDFIVYDYTISDSYTNLLYKLEKYEIENVSMDVFDTVLIRKDDDEEERFKRVSEKMSEILGIKSKIIFNARMFSHRAAYSIKKDSFIEPTVDQIFKIMCSELNISEKNINKMINVELEFEKEVLYLNEDLWNAIRNSQLNYFFVSDMYLRAKHICQLLDHFGVVVNINDLYVSCDLNCSKRQSGIYEKIAKIYDPKKTLHIGDNYLSDIKNAQSFGFQTFFIRHTNVK